MGSMRILICTLAVDCAALGVEPLIMPLSTESNDGVCKQNGPGFPKVCMSLLRSFRVSLLEVRQYRFQEYSVDFFQIYPKLSTVRPGHLYTGTLGFILKIKVKPLFK